MMIRNLVALLIKDNEDIYNKLLHNRFCHAMGQAPASDTAVADGFKWYMIVRLAIPAPMK